MAQMLILGVMLWSYFQLLLYFKICEFPPRVYENIGQVDEEPTIAQVQEQKDSVKSKLCQSQNTAESEEI